MSREIKFRGKRDDTGEWIYWNGITGHGLKYNYPLNETVGQYTGLKDKNGKEIYEGDIVEMDNDLYIVDYINDECAYRLRRAKNNSISMFTLQNFKTTFIEIIGNIHENGDLL